MSSHGWAICLFFSLIEYIFRCIVWNASPWIGEAGYTHHMQPQPSTPVQWPRKTHSLAAAVFVPWLKLIHLMKGEYCSWGNIRGRSHLPALDFTSAQLSGPNPGCDIASVYMYWFFKHVEQNIDWGESNGSTGIAYRVEDCTTSAGTSIISPFCLKSVLYLIFTHQHTSSRKLSARQCLHLYFCALTGLFLWPQ